MLATACSSSSTSSGGAGGSKSAFIDAYCATVASCCGTQQLPTDGKVCHLNLGATAGTFDSAQAQTCIDQIQAAAKNDATWCVSSNPNPACTNVIQSLLDVGGSSGTRGALGDTCDSSVTYDATGNEIFAVATGVYCSSDDGLYCNSETKKCANVVTSGGGCILDEDCGAEATCNLFTNECSPLGRIGDACGGGVACVATVAACDSTQTCVAVLPGGATCNDNQPEACASENCVSGACQDSSDGNGPGLQQLCGAPPDQ